MELERGRHGKEAEPPQGKDLEARSGDLTTWRRENMAVHTQMQVTSLLRPFADHVLEIEASVKEISESLDRAHVRIDQLDYRHENTFQQVNLVRADVSPLKAHLVKLQNEIARVDKDRDALETEHISTRRRTDAVEEGVKSAMAHFCDVRRELDSAVDRLSPLEAICGALTTTSSEDIAAEKRDLWDKMKQLEEQADLSRKNLQAQEIFLKKLSDAYDDAKRENAKHRQHVDSTIQLATTEVQCLAKSADDLRERVGRYDADFKKHLQRINSLQASVDSLTAEKNALQDQADKTSEDVIFLKGRFLPFEKTLNMLEQKSTAQDKLLQGQADDEKRRKNQEEKSVGQVRTLADTLLEFDQKLVATMKTVAELKEAQEVSATELREATEGLGQRIDKTQDGLNQSISDVKGISDWNHNEIKAMQEGTLDVLGIQKEMQGAIQQNTDRCQRVHGDMGDIQKALAALREQLARVETRVELCDEQFSGLRKGFREVRVIGTEDALLPERPAISRPQSGRTSRCATPSLPSMSRANPSSGPTVTAAWGLRSP